MESKVRVIGFDAVWAEDLSYQINEFLNENDVEVIDIKHSSSRGDSGRFCTALLIYKEK